MMMINAPHDFESVIPQYPVKLDNFEGPLDLLVHLIRRHEIDIWDIPIVLITKQYLEYLELMKELDLDVAGEFLIMAATLIQIKSRMLVPRPETAKEGEDAGDPRDALVQRLIEHQKYRAAAELLHERETVRSAQWMRPDSRVADIAGQPIEREVEVDLFSLLQAFRRWWRAREKSDRWRSRRKPSRSSSGSGDSSSACRKPRRAVSRTCSSGIAAGPIS